MVEGGGVGGWPVVGDKGRDSARSGDFAAAGEHLPALRVRPLGRSLAPESRAGRCHSRSLRRRSGGGFRKPDGGGAIPERVSGTACEIRPRITSREDETDSVWAVRRPEPKEAWRGKAGDLYLSGFYALLREAPERWSIH